MPLFDVCGAGIWHLKDDSALLTLLDPRRAKGATPFRLSQAAAMAAGQPTVGSHATLLNLAKAFGQDEPVTTRVNGVFS